MYFHEKLLEEVKEIVVLSQRREHSVIGDDGRCEPLVDSSEDNVDITSSSDVFDPNCSDSSLVQAPNTESHYNLFEPQEDNLLLANNNVSDSENDDDDDDDAAPQSSQQQQGSRSRKSFQKVLSSFFKKTRTRMVGRFSTFHNKEDNNSNCLRLDRTERTENSTTSSTFCPTFPVSSMSGSFQPSNRSGSILEPLMCEDESGHFLN